MTEFPTITFLSPAWLFLLPVVLGLILAYLHFFQRFSMWSKVCDTRMLKLLTSANRKESAEYWLPMILVIVFCLGVIAMAGPSWEKQQVPLLESAAARVILLDLSQSMLAQDIKPNRLDLAINSTRKIINSDFDGETGLVVFSGASFLVSPLTRDANTLLEFVKALKPGTMPLDGSRLDLAISKAQRLLLASVTKTGQIIIISDGISHVDKAIAAAFEAGKQGNQVSVLSVGTPHGAPLKNGQGEFMQDSDGRFILAKTNIAELRSVASAGKGLFIELSQSSNVDSLIMEIESSARVQLQNRQQDAIEKPSNGGIWLLWLMLPFVLLLFRKNVFWVILIVNILPLGDELNAMEAGDRADSDGAQVTKKESQADDPGEKLNVDFLWRNTEQRAYQAYQRGDFEQVIELSNAPVLVGTAFYKRQDYQSAFEHFSQLESATAYFNQANMLTLLGRFDEALIAYNQALEFDPGYDDARFNGDLIEAFLLDQTTIESEQSTVADESDDMSGQNDELFDQFRIGASNLESENRDASDEAGLGASQQSEQGQFNEGEEFSGIDVTLEQIMRQLRSEDFDPDPEMVELWTQSLIADPTELFRRKFLRDYQRSIVDRR